MPCCLHLVALSRARRLARPPRPHRCRDNAAAATVFDIHVLGVTVNTEPQPLVAVTICAGILKATVPSLATNDRSCSWAAASSASNCASSRR